MDLSSLITGISARTWLILGGVAAAALAIWLAYCWAWDRGAAARAAIDAPEIAKLNGEVATLQGNVTTLQAAIEARNREIEAYAAAQRAKEAAAAQQAKDALKALEAARKREAARGSGADAMNGFFSDILGGA